MNDTSKQEEFLDRLKDPTKAKLNDAIKEFRYAHPSIQDVRVFTSPNDLTYYIEVYADNFGILITTSEIFKNTIRKHVGKNILIHERRHPGEKDKDQEKDLFRHSYFIDIALSSNLVLFDSQALKNLLAKRIAEAIDKEIVKAFCLPKNLLPDND